MPWQNRFSVRLARSEDDAQDRHNSVVLLNGFRDDPYEHASARLDWVRLLTPLSAPRLCARLFTSSVTILRASITTLGAATCLAQVGRGQSDVVPSLRTSSG